MPSSWAALKEQGFDITEGQRARSIEIVGTRGQIAKLRRAGVTAKPLLDRRGRRASRIAAAQAADGWQVWRPYARTDVPVSGAAGNPTANTFDPPNRLWRKNLRDNNGDGQISAIDGVDLNRNFPTKWNYDDEGSNTERSSETFRGTGPASEPETQAFTSLTKRVDFAYNKNDHTHGKLLLWPPGWQVDTRRR